MSKYRDLLSEAAKLAECRQARSEWVRETAEAWRLAQEAMDERCQAAADKLDEEAFERLFAEEDAKVEAFRAPMQLAHEKDLWPKELYRSGL